MNSGAIQHVSDLPSRTEIDGCHLETLATRDRGRRALFEMSCRRCIRALIIDKADTAETSRFDTHFYALCNCRMLFATCSCICALLENREVRKETKRERRFLSATASSARLGMAIPSPNFPSQSQLPLLVRCRWSMFALTISQAHLITTCHC